MGAQQSGGTDAGAEEAGLRRESDTLGGGGRERFDSGLGRAKLGSLRGRSKKAGGAEEYEGERRVGATEASSDGVALAVIQRVAAGGHDGDATCESAGAHRGFPVSVVGVEGDGGRAEAAQDSKPILAALAMQHRATDPVDMIATAAALSAAKKADTITAIPGTDAVADVHVYTDTDTDAEPPTGTAGVRTSRGREPVAPGIVSLCEIGYPEPPIVPLWRASASTCSSPSEGRFRAARGRAPCPRPVAASPLGQRTSVLKTRHGWQGTPPRARGRPTGGHEAIGCSRETDSSIIWVHATHASSNPDRGEARRSKSCQPHRSGASRGTHQVSSESSDEHRASGQFAVPPATYLQQEAWLRGEMRRISGVDDDDANANVADASGSECTSSPRTAGRGQQTLSGRDKQIAAALMRARGGRLRRSSSVHSNSGAADGLPSSRCTDGGDASPSALASTSDAGTDHVALDPPPPVVPPATPAGFMMGADYSGSGRGSPPLGMWPLPPAESQSLPSMARRRSIDSLFGFRRNRSSTDVKPPGAGAGTRRGEPHSAEMPSQKSLGTLGRVRSLGKGRRTAGAEDEPFGRGNSSFSALNRRRKGRATDTPAPTPPMGTPSASGASPLVSVTEALISPRYQLEGDTRRMLFQWPSAESDTIRSDPPNAAPAAGAYTTDALAI